MNSRAHAVDNADWQVLSEQVEFENPHLTVVTEEVRSPGHPRAHRWTTVRRKCAVIIAPLTADGKLVLVRQERVPIRRAIWEVPAGQVDEPEAESDDIAAVALRELREETGYQLAAGGELVSLGELFSSPGFTDETAFLFLAHPVEPGASGHEHQESESILDCRAFAAPELAAMIVHNEIRDSNTLGICAKLVARGLLTLHV